MTWRFATAACLAVLQFAGGGCSPTAGGGAPAALTPASPATVAQPPGKSRAIPAGDPLDGYRESTFDDVKFPMELNAEFQESLLTPSVRGLFDKPIRIRGYMYPTLRKNGLKQFVLVRDNLECCFGPGAALYDCILVTMTPPATASYSIKPIAVAGTFRFEPLSGPDGRPVAIYRMAADRVE